MESRVVDVPYLDVAAYKQDLYKQKIIKFMKE